MIHLCEKQVVAPDIKDAGGRGSSRVFSARNFLELAIALRLRDVMLPVTATGAIIHVVEALEDKLGEEIPGFSLVNSLTAPNAPDLRVIISDGHLIFFSLGLGDTPAKLFGGVSIEDVEGNAGSRAGRLKVLDPAADETRFGGAEGSSFARLEISLTAIARSLPFN